MGKKTFIGVLAVVMFSCTVVAACLFLKSREMTPSLDESQQVVESKVESTENMEVQVPDTQATKEPDTQEIDVDKVDKAGNPVDTIYRSDMCLYMSPASSAFVSTDGYDSKAYYHFTDIGFERMEKVEKGKAGIRWNYYLPEGGPKWEEFPFTMEEWNEFFEGADKSDLLSGYEQIEYMELLEGDAFLLKPDDELWMVIIYETQAGRCIWCIYTLVPVTEEISSVKEYYLLPHELNEMTTEELLELASRNSINAFIYEQMTLYLEMLCRRYNGAEELVKRENLAQVVLDAFQEDTFLIKKDLPQSQWEEQEAYDAECREKNYKIALEEVLLATNIAFEQMDEDMKQATLKEAYEKVDLRLSGRFASGNTIGTYPSGFFGYIRATKDSGSKWYEYLVEQGEEEVLKLMEDDFIHQFMP